MFYSFSTILLTLHLFGSKVIAADDLNRPSRWFEPRTGDYVQHTQQPYELNEYEEIPLDIRLVHHTDIENSLIEANRNRSIFHNPKFVGVVLGVMLIILATFIYLLVERVIKNH